MRLSVNVNKIATLRNSRGKNQPSVSGVIQDLIRWGVKGITMHPRPDGRHILYQDVKEAARLLKNLPSVEFNVEGYPSESFLNLIAQAAPEQCTLVPDPPHALTSTAGWDFDLHQDLLKNTLHRLQALRIRSSLFLDPFTFNDKALEILLKLHPGAVELYTERYASVFEQSRTSPTNRCELEKTLHRYKEVAGLIHSRGIRIHAGHDLNSSNLKCLLKALPFIQEVSIGHAFICEALYEGLKTVTKQYLSLCGSSPED